MTHMLKALLLGLSLCLVSLPSISQIKGEFTTYTVAGKTYEGYLAYNANLKESRGTVLIVHDWDGLTEYEVTRADMLAALGYTAFAVDVYGKETRPTNFDENRAFSGALYADREEFRSRLMGSLKAAQSLKPATKNIAVMGYCFGGAAVLEMARAGTNVDAFISFHGGLTTPEGQNYAKVKAPILFEHGSADPVSGPADLAMVLADLTANNKPHMAHLYGGARHSFTVFESGDYLLEADQKSWQALQNFLEAHL